MRSNIRALVAELRGLMEEPKWVRPDVTHTGERGELLRTRRSLGRKGKTRPGVSAADLHKAVSKAKLGHLSDKHWSKATNTDSWKLDKKAAAKHAETYGRDIKRVYKGFKAGDKIPAPIVLHRPGKRPYVVAGNTRLMAASATGIRPKVLHVRLKK